ncbi:MAG: hypothetical protein LC667_16145, partial [Thioalkalivibrio sp.]|nr:hypothetical protein [Thioalkalivibrio sp.]
VAFFDDHAIWQFGPPGLYLLRLSVIDPADALMVRGLVKRTLKAVAEAATLSDLELLPALVRPFRKVMRCALEADVRWLRAQFTACMNLDLRRQEHGNWVQVEAEEAAALFNPMAHDRIGVPRASDLRIDGADIASAEAELSSQRQADTTAARLAWSHRFPGFKESLAARLMVVGEEGRNAVALATEELRRAEAALEVAQERGNRAQITRADNARDTARDTLGMTRAFWDERTRWLWECEEEVRLVLPREKLTALVRTRNVS